MLRADDPLLSPRTPPELRAGDLHFQLTEAGLGSMTWHGVEVLRGLTYPIRDADWGTIPATVLEETGDGLAFRRVFAAAQGGVSGTFELTATAAGQLEARLVLKVKRRMTVCRAGFALLLPINGLSGSALSILSSDGRQEATAFPRTISPHQPARDIAALRYSMHGCDVTLEFSGDVFEMEDQRNWSDASYKVYCRPLSLPSPYVIEAGETITQAIRITLSNRPDRAASARNRPEVISLATEPSGEIVPAVALAVERGWSHPLPKSLALIPKLIRLDLDADDLALLDGLRSPLDLELVTADALETARTQLAHLAREIEARKLSVASIIALPRAYLRSHQPDGAWPSGASPADLVTAARLAFPGALIGGGMLTNFTEFNRYRPDPSSVDFITHGSSAIVHAADDTSVFQTLEALPHILGSTRAIAPRTRYRLGLVSIGMRSNPYGEGLSNNPESIQRTMTADDPKARTRAGAAWMVGAMAATRGFAIERVALAAPGGPFGIAEPGGPGIRPSFHVVRALHALTGLPRTDKGGFDPSVAIVSAMDGSTLRAVAANVGRNDAELSMPQGANLAVLGLATENAAANPEWLSAAATPVEGTVRLSAYEIAFINIPASAGTAA